MPPLFQKLNKLRYDLAQAAQLVVDEWSQNEEGFDEELEPADAYLDEEVPF